MTASRSRAVAIGGLALSLAVLCPRAATAQFSPIKGREYREFMNPVIPVRGEALVGVAVVQAPGASRSAVVEVWLPGRFSGDLQLETLTADGRFRGVGAYTGSTNGPGWVALTLLDNPARPADPMTLALGVRGSDSTLFAARWRTDASPAASVRLYVNSRRADVFVRAGGAPAVRCTPVAIAHPVRFDAYCDVPAAAIAAGGAVTIIRRDQFDEQSQTVRVDARGLR
jgi:hypothetical protein